MSVAPKEIQLKKPVVKFLKALGCEHLRIEVTFADRGVDVFAVTTGPNPDSYAVELKLRDWQKAIRQAAIYQLCADYCFVAMPYDKASRLDSKLFEEAGIGLLSVDLSSKDVTMLLPARKSSVKSTVHSGSLQKSLIR